MNIELRDYFAAHAPSPQQPMELAEHCAYRYRYADAMLAAREAGRVEKKADDGWIDHSSNHIPVCGDTQVEVRFRDNETARWCAREFFWDQKGLNSDIIAYRVVQS